jgi:hypothetical protein
MSSTSGSSQERFFRQDDRIGAERRKTAAGSPKGERSESIYRRIIGMLEITENMECLWNDE